MSSKKKRKKFPAYPEQTPPTSPRRTCVTVCRLGVQGSGGGLGSGGLQMEFGEKYNKLNRCWTSKKNKKQLSVTGQERVHPRDTLTLTPVLHGPALIWCLTHISQQRSDCTPCGRVAQPFKHSDCILHPPHPPSVHAEGEVLREFPKPCSSGACVGHTSCCLSTLSGSHAAHCSGNREPLNT